MAFIFFLNMGLVVCSNGQKITIKGTHSRKEWYSLAWELAGHKGVQYAGMPGTDSFRLELDLFEVDISEAFKRIHHGTDITESILFDTVLLVSREHQGDLDIFRHPCGWVVDPIGMPLAGATVTLLNSQSVAKTDSIGYFRLSGLRGSLKVRISFVGYGTEEVNLADTLTPLIHMKEKAKDLNVAKVSTDAKFSAVNVPLDMAGVSARGFSQSACADVTGLLPGRVPGLLLSLTNGGPASSVEVKIRGDHSIAAGSGPMWAIEGMPLSGINAYQSEIGSGSALGLLGVNTLNLMDPGDIDSIEVLKGPAAIAGYGSRGVNGVINIRLKRPDTACFTLRGEIKKGVSRVLSSGSYLNTSDYLSLRREAILNDGLPVDNKTLPEGLLWDSMRYTNFKKQQTDNVANWREGRIGGNLYLPAIRLRELLNLHYHEESGVYKQSAGSKRWGLLSNTMEDFFDRRLTIALIELMGYESDHLPLYDPSYMGQTAPNAPNSYINGNAGSWSQDGLSYINMQAAAGSTYQNSIWNWFHQIQLCYGRDTGFSVRGRVGYHLLDGKETMVVPISAQDPGVQPTGHKTVNHAQYKSLLMELTSQYVWQLPRGRWQLSGGGIWQQERKLAASWVGDGYTSDSALDEGVPPDVSTSRSQPKYRFGSMFLTASYSYGNRYSLSATVRSDASSRLAKGNQRGFFGVVSGAYVFTGPKVLHVLPWLDVGRVRLSHGVTGNDQIPDFQYARSYGQRSSSRGYQGLQGVVPVTLGDPSLSWESHRSWEAGLELSGLKDRIGFTAVVYRNLTKDPLVNQTLASQAGLPALFTNQRGVVLLNRGIELGLQVHLSNLSAFKWMADFSLSFQGNKLTDFPGLGSSPYSQTLVVGESIHVVRGLRYTGVDPNTGLFTFRGADGSRTYDRQNYMTVGSLDVPCFAGWYNWMQYKAFSLEFTWDIRWQTVRNPVVSYYEQNGPGMAAPSMLSNVPTSFLAHWKHAGDRSTLQKLTSMDGTDAANMIGYFNVSSAQVTDGSFARLKNVCLRFATPGHWWGKWGLNQGLFYVSAQNLFTVKRLKDADPETIDIKVIPPTRTVVVGFQIKIK